MGIGEATNVTTEKARLSYVHLFKPYAAMQGQEEKFSVTVPDPEDGCGNNGPDQCSD